MNTHTYTQIHTQQNTHIYNTQNTHTQHTQPYTYPSHQPEDLYDVTITAYKNVFYASGKHDVNMMFKAQVYTHLLMFTTKET